METNIDDCSGEVLGFVMERLMKAGARDVHYVPVFMKKIKTKIFWTKSKSVEIETKMKK